MYKVLFAIGICFILICAFIYINVTQGQRDLTESYININSQYIENIHKEHEQYINRLYNCIDTLLKANKSIPEIYETLYINHLPSISKEIPSISFFDTNLKCFSSTNKLNMGMYLNNISYSNKNKWSNNIYISHPYIVKIDEVQTLFVDVIFRFENSTYILFRLNVDSFFSHMDELTYIIHTSSKLIAYPYDAKLSENYNKFMGSTQYLKNEFGNIQENSYIISNKIFSLLQNNNYESSEYLSISKKTKFGYTLVKLIPIDKVNLVEIKYLIVQYLCYILICSLLIYIIYKDTKELKNLRKFLKAEQFHSPCRADHANVICSIKELSQKVQSLQKELNNQVIEFQSEKTAIIMSNNEKYKDIILKFSKHTNVLSDTNNEIEKLLYELHSKIQDNSLKVMLLYFIIKYSLGIKIASSNVKNSFENQQILEDFRNYLNEQKVLNIDIYSIDKEVLLNLVEMFKKDISYISKYVNTDKFIEMSDRVDELIKEITDIQNLVIKIKPYISLSSNEINKLISILNK